MPSSDNINDTVFGGTTTDRESPLFRLGDSQQGSPGPNETSNPLQSKSAAPYDAEGAMKFIVVTVGVYALLGILSLLLVRIVRRAKQHLNPQESITKNEEFTTVRNYLRERQRLAMEGHRQELMHHKTRVALSLWDTAIPLLSASLASSGTRSLRTQASLATVAETDDSLHKENTHRYGPESQQSLPVLPIQVDHVKNNVNPEHQYQHTISALTPSEVSDHKKNPGSFQSQIQDTSLTVPFDIDHEQDANSPCPQRQQQLDVFPESECSGINVLS